MSRGGLRSVDELQRNWVFAYCHWTAYNRQLTWFTGIRLQYYAAELRCSPRVRDSVASAENQNKHWISQSNLQAGWFRDTQHELCTRTAQHSMYSTASQSCVNGGDAAQEGCTRLWVDELWSVRTSNPSECAGRAEQVKKS